MKLGKPVFCGTIAVDIDGVLCNFERGFSEAFGDGISSPYELEERYPHLNPELIREWVKTPENYRDLEPIFGGLLFTRQAQQRGWYILLVTSRDKVLQEVTKNWLARYGAVYNEIIFTMDKRESIMEYDALHSSRPVKIVVDDSVAVLENMPEKYGIAMANPWNRGYYPFMRYDTKEMKIKMYTDEFSPSKGIWDRVK